VLEGLKLQAWFWIVWYVVVPEMAAVSPESELPPQWYLTVFSMLA